MQDGGGPEIRAPAWRKFKWCQLVLPFFVWAPAPGLWFCQCLHTCGHCDRSSTLLRQTASFRCSCTRSMVGAGYSNSAGASEPEFLLPGRCPGQSARPWGLQAATSGDHRAEFGKPSSRQSNECSFGHSEAVRALEVWFVKFLNKTNGARCAALALLVVATK